MNSQNRVRVYQIVVQEDFHVFRQHYVQQPGDGEGDLDNAFAHYLAQIAVVLTRVYAGCDIDVRPCYERSHDDDGTFVFPAAYRDEVEALLLRARQHALRVVNTGGRTTAAHSVAGRRE